MNKPYVIGICGGSASGKTSFVNRLREQFGEKEVCLVSQDNYYRDSSYHTIDERGQINFDLPECIDITAFKRDLNLLKQGERIELKEYKFQLEGHEPKFIRINPAPIIIVEGLFIFYFQEIFEQLHLKLFIDAKEEIKFTRRLQRDVVERGISREQVVYQWEFHVKPAYQQFLSPFKEKADIIINNNAHFNESLWIIENHLKSLLNHEI